MNSKRRTISVTGAALAGLYGLASAACIALALTASDFKSRYVLLQLPIALQSSILPNGMLERVSWPLAYLVFALPTLVALYVLGAALGAFVSAD